MYNEAILFIAYLLTGFISLTLIKRLLLIDEITNREYAFWGFFLSIITINIYSLLYGELPNDFIGYTEFGYSAIVLILLSICIGLSGTLIFKLLDALLEKTRRKFIQSKDSIKKFRESVLDIISEYQTFFIVTTKDGMRYLGRIESCGELIDKKHKTAIYLVEPKIINTEVNNKNQLRMFQRVNGKNRVKGIVILEDEISTIEVLEPPKGKKKEGA